MNRATSQMRNLARRLIVYETRGNDASETKTTAIFHVCERLRPQLATLMGNGGFRALLARALALASKEVPWLRAVRVDPDGSVVGLEELHAQPDSGEVFAGRVVLLAQLLELLTAFIGEDLSLRLVREVWPRFPLTDLDFGTGVKYQPTRMKKLA